jgi:hypothetical protein|tara:strand:- start:162 stop:575 length:414 start_codon:yes stop_codon:yes gene_type:complete
MKYWIPLLAFILFTVPSWGLDLTLPEPEEPYDYEEIEIPEVYIFNFGDYNEPPTRTQLTIFWTLNALDVWTTHRALKDCPNCREMNPLLPDRPKLEDLLLQKAIVGGIIHWQSSSDYMTGINIGLTYAVVNNYKIVY